MLLIVYSILHQDTFNLVYKDQTSKKKTKKKKTGIRIRYIQRIKITANY